MKANHNGHYTNVPRKRGDDPINSIANPLKDKCSPQARG
ncbi:hypothetical protein PG2011B_1430 [Bifidobacterium animalis subsp. lactis]|uniref:Uncharacterized protein n=1 Tax=Bifidobacterium animalis subsp. lactis TaxID=302911 RepID=A0A8B3RGT8_BIFAN|nr:hypothetical protein PG2011B_1430 [Bifidobacterium animalis subsp. lactis]